MLTQLSKEITDDEIDAAFDLIDEDNSNTVEFEELNNYFSKVNGIPKHLNRPSGHLEDSAGINGANIFQNMFSNYGSNHPQQQMQPMGYPQPYYQQPMYYPPPPGYGYQQQQQPPPHQSNYFSNFMMHHLQNQGSQQGNNSNKGW